MPRGCGAGDRGLVTRSGIKPNHHLPLRHPVGWQRISLKPKQAHTPGLLPGQNALDDGWLQPRQAEQVVGRWVVQAFALGNFAAAADHTVVEQLLPIKGPRQRDSWTVMIESGVILRVGSQYFHFTDLGCSLYLRL